MRLSHSAVGNTKPTGGHLTPVLVINCVFPLPASTESDLRNPNKAQLRAGILALRESGISYRQIAREVGLHWTRVQQIVKSAE
jgi:hypothetical protein